MRLVAISDTHGFHRQLPMLPDGDVLIHAGDITLRGLLDDFPDFFAWFASQPHRWKIVIAGNHDFAFERTPEDAKRLVPKGVTYLRDSGIRIRRIGFWGSPWQPWFNHWAFNLLRGEEIAAKWALIPLDTQVLITHGPPHGTLDELSWPPKERVGCEALRDRLQQLLRLRVHIFGHIHEAYGVVQEGERQFVNASTCTRRYAPINAPVVIDL